MARGGIGTGVSDAFDPLTRTRLEKVIETLTTEFDGTFDESHVAAVVYESAGRFATVEVSDFVPVFAQRFARERLRAQARTEGKIERGVPEVLFVSLTGGGRAQIGAALLARHAGTRLAAHSAGSSDAGMLDANVRTAMAEIGIDLSDEFTRPLTPEVLETVDVIVTMGRSVGAVEIPDATRHVDWRVGDPAGAPLAEVVRVREDIDRRVQALVAELVALAERAPTPV